MRAVQGCCVQCKVLGKSLHLPGMLVILMRSHRDHLGTTMGYRTNTHKCLVVDMLVEARPAPIPAAARPPNKVLTFKLLSLPRLI